MLMSSYTNKAIQYMISNTKIHIQSITYNNKQIVLNLATKKLGKQKQNGNSFQGF